MWSGVLKRIFSSLYLFSSIETAGLFNHLDWTTQIIRIIVRVNRKYSGIG